MKQIKLDKVIAGINDAIEGRCTGYMSRFYGEWYYLSISFEFSSLHINLTISEETMLGMSTDCIIRECLKCTKSDIMERYFK